MASVVFKPLPGWDGWKRRKKLAWKARLGLREKDPEIAGIRNLAYVMAKTLDAIKKRDGYVDDLKFTGLVFIQMKELEKKGIKLPLPYAWFIHGPTISWPTLREKLNKIGLDLEYVPEYHRDLPD